MSRLFLLKIAAVVMFVTASAHELRQYSPGGNEGARLQQFIDGHWRDLPLVVDDSAPIPPDPEPIPPEPEPEPIYGDPMGEWSEGNNNTKDGATRDYYNKAMSLQWRNELGDWHDAENEAQGGVPFVSESITQPGVMAFDVTELVNKWQSGQYINKGFLLRLLSGVSLSWRSKEYVDSTEHPKLLLTDTDGQAIELKPIGDVTLDRSTYSDLGASSVLTASTQANTVIKFDTEGLGEMREALLVMHAHSKTSGSINVGVFRATQTHYEPEDEVRSGLAATVDSDSELEGHEDVYLYTSFDETTETGEPDWQSKWSWNYKHVVPVPVDEATAFAGLNFAPWDGKALQVGFKQGINAAVDSGFAFADKNIAEPEELYIRYMLRVPDPDLPNAFDPIQPGKLPGFSGTYGRCGNGGAPANGYCWSARMHFNPYAPDHNTLAGYLPVGNYVYHMDMNGNYGTHMMWTRDYNGILQTDQWHCVDAYVKLNTPAADGEPEKSDGILRGWINGRLAFENTGIRFRSDPLTKIYAAWLVFYHGGRPPPPEDQYLWIDNFVAAKQFIGCR